MLPENSEALRLLHSVRDEAHRFATTFRKRVRATQLNSSVPESIKGIGKERSRTLLTAFGSVDELKPEAVARTGSISLEKAQELIAYLS